MSLLFSLITSSTNEVKVSKRLNEEGLKGYLRKYKRYHENIENWLSAKVSS